jgi:hypothetical protein
MQLTGAFTTFTTALFTSARLAATHLIYGHCAHWHRTVAHDPFSGLMDVGPCGQVHDGVRSPDGRPLKLFNLLQQSRKERKQTTEGDSRQSTTNKVVCGPPTVCTAAVFRCACSVLSFTAGMVTGRQQGLALSQPGKANQQLRLARQAALARRVGGQTIQEGIEDESGVIQGESG